MATSYGRSFVFGIPTQEKLLEIEQSLMPDEIIAEHHEYLKIVIDGKMYAVEILENGYSAFLFYD